MKELTLNMINKTLKAIEAWHLSYAKAHLFPSFFQIITIK